jgi:hypothetical protein
VLVVKLEATLELKLEAALAVEWALAEELELGLELCGRVVMNSRDAVMLAHFGRLEVLLTRELEKGVTETGDGVGVMLLAFAELLGREPVGELELYGTDADDRRVMVPMPNPGTVEAALVRELQLEMTVVMNGVGVATPALLEPPRDRLPVSELALALEHRVVIDGVGSVTTPALCPRIVIVDVRVLIVVTVTVPAVVLGL